MKIFMQKFPIVAMAAIVMLLFMNTFGQEKCIFVMFVRKFYNVKHKTKNKQTIKKTRLIEWTTLVVPSKSLSTVQFYYKPVLQYNPSILSHFLVIVAQISDITN